MKMLTLLMMVFALPSAASTHKIVYEIPAPAELEPFSRFDLTYELTRLENGRTKISYKLPKLLLGSEVEFQFEGVADFNKESFTLRAPNAEMTCQPFPRHALCQVKYRGVKVELEQVRDTLNKMPISRAEKQGRFELASMVAKAGGDFAGILYFVNSPEYEALRMMPTAESVR